MLCVQYRAELLHLNGAYCLYANPCTPTQHTRTPHRSHPQGEEANVILLSTVRNNPAGSIGFLRMRNRVNVMLSRARHGMVVLGHAPTLRAGAARSKEPMWSNVLDCFAAQGCLGPCLKVLHTLSFALLAGCRGL